MHMATLGLNRQMLPVFLGIMTATAIAWLFLSKRLYAELRRNHPMLYDTLGRPRLFMDKSFTTNYRVLRLLFRQDHEARENPAVMHLCHGLRSLFYIYMFCLAGCVLLFFTSPYNS